MSKPSTYARLINGALVDLCDLRAEQVDFSAIAAALARGIRYAGNTAVPVSIAQHTLIAADCARAQGAAWAVPFVLLHDAHEAFIGDITTPAAKAIDHYARHAGERTSAYTLMGISALKCEIDRSIWDVAGFGQCYYFPEVTRAIHAADRGAYLVELRDFHRAIKPHDPEYHAIQNAPLKRVQRVMSTAAAEMALQEAFREHLPCFGAALPVIPTAKAAT